MGITYDDQVELVFNHPKLDQLEVTAREVDIDTYVRVVWLTGGGRTAYTPENEAHLAELFEIIGGSLVSWNLDRPGTEPPEPLPCDASELRKLARPLSKAICDAWIDGQAGLSDPFAEPSNDGAPLAEIRQTPLAS